MRGPASLLALACLAVASGCATGTAPYEAGVFRPVVQRRIAPLGNELELLWNEGEFTEGPAPAPDGSILFTDIGDRIMKFDPKTKQVSVFREKSGRANGLMFDAQGRLVACEGANGGNRRVSITDPSGAVRTLADQWSGRRLNSPNDLAIGPDGRVWFTDPRYVGMETREMDFEGVFMVETDGTVKLATRELQKPNGILVSADGRTVYVADNNSDPKGNHRLVAFHVWTDGSIRDPKILYDFGPDRRGIDGMTLDREGNIYATAGRGEEAGVYVFSPRGVHLSFIRTPGDPTNCVFGRGAEASTLYITAQGPSLPGAARKYALYRIKLALPGYHVADPR